MGARIPRNLAATIIGALQIYGGLTLVMLALEGIRAGRVVDSWAATTIAIGFGALCTFTGIQLLERRQIYRWLCVSIWLTQVPIVYFRSYAYQIFCGAKIPLILWLPEVDIRIGMRMGSGVLLANPDVSGSMAVGLNILALAIVVQLWPRHGPRRLLDADQVQSNLTT